MAKALKTGGFILLILFGAAVLWGVGIEPRLIEETRYKVRIPYLPAHWRGKEIGFISDPQLGIFLDNEGTVRRIIDRLISERPSVVLIGGDFIYHPTEDETKVQALEESEPEDAEVRSLIRKVAGLLRPLTDSGITVYTVLGNHDYAMQTREALKLPWVAEELTRELEKLPIRVLNNEAVPMKSPLHPEEKSPLYLVGIGPHYPGKDRVEKAFEALPGNAPRIVMTHNPQPFARIPAGAAPLAVAGHTHGGQIRLPFLENWSWLDIVREGDVHADGWIRGFGQPGNRLYVNRGIGFSVLPIRINCRPELTYFRLLPTEPER